MPEMYSRFLCPWDRLLRVVHVRMGWGGVGVGWGGVGVGVGWGTAQPHPLLQ